LQWRTWELLSYSQFALATEANAFATSSIYVLLQLAMAAASNRTTSGGSAEGRSIKAHQICPEAIVIFRPD